MSKEWKRTPRGNYILEACDFGISYNAFSGGEEIFSYGEIFSSDNGVSETALCKGGSYYILNGDFRKEYENLIEQGWGECIKFFDSKPESHSSWSD